MKFFAKDLCSIYTVPDEKTAFKRLEEADQKWSPHYPTAMRRWYDHWDVITPIFKFSVGVRTSFYTTNIIESLNASYHRLNRQRSVFPSAQALLKVLYLVTFEATKKWTMPIKNWGKSEANWRSCIRTDCLINTCTHLIRSDLQTFLHRPDSL